jgi:hypothetical protein
MNFLAIIAVVLFAFAIIGLPLMVLRTIAIIWPNGAIARRVHPPPTSLQESMDKLLAMQQEILDELRLHRQFPPQPPELPALEVSAITTIQPRYRTRANRAAEGSQGLTL